MSDPLVRERAREQLHELISILGELRNAGSRDARFKQWRQITLTLLQRAWPGDSGRAERFRRIAFSAASPGADRKAVRECFERGCGEASAYLGALAGELAGGATPAAAPSAGSVSTPGHAGIPGPADAAVPPAGLPGPAEAAPAGFSFTPPAGVPGAADAAPPPAAPPPMASPPRLEAITTARPPATAPEGTMSAPGSRLRLKDMLGFTDDAPPAARSSPTRGPLTSPPAGAAAGGSSPPLPVPPAAALPGPAERAPVAGDPVSPAARDLASELGLESAVREGSPGPTRHRSEPRGAAVPSAAVREILTMAAMVEELGVPARSRSIVRAALVDLARQMEFPPVHWQAIRQAVAFALDHPDLARRVLPLVLPYLDEAA